MENTGITREEFIRAVLDEYEAKVRQAPSISVEWLFNVEVMEGGFGPLNRLPQSCSHIPCSYKNLDYLCPLTGKKVRTRPLPKTFKSVCNPELRFLAHSINEICLALNMKSLTKCFAVVGEEYHIHEHTVGNCPWKTVSPKKL